MKRWKFSEEQITYVPRQHGAGKPAADICRQLGISERLSTSGRRSTRTWACPSFGNQMFESRAEILDPILPNGFQAVPPSFLEMCRLSALPFPSSLYASLRNVFRSSIDIATTNVVKSATITGSKDAIGSVVPASKVS